MELPLREELVGIPPYGAPQLDVPVALNVNENPYPPSESLVAAVADAVAKVTRTLNRYPDRELVEKERPGVVLLPSPNNPTGTALPSEAVTSLCEAVGDGRSTTDGRCSPITSRACPTSRVKSSRRRPTTQPVIASRAYSGYIE